MFDGDFTVSLATPQAKTSLRLLLQHVRREQKTEPDNALSTLHAVRQRKYTFQLHTGDVINILISCFLTKISKQILGSFEKNYSKFLNTKLSFLSTLQLERSKIGAHERNEERWIHCREGGGSWF